ncbi:MAG: polysaccharide biosynthesis tyrosine autokinase [Acidimicrobiales bacterium]
MIIVPPSTPPPYRVEDELELADYLAILRRRARWVVASVVVVVAAATALTVTSVPRYEATAKVSLGESAAQEAIRSAGPVNGATAARELTNEVNLALGDHVTDEVTARLGHTPEIEVTAEESSDALSFTASAGNGEDAAAGANAWAESYVDTKRTQATDSIDGALQAFETDLSELRQKRQDLRAPVDELELQLASTTDEEVRQTLEAQIVVANADISAELDLIDARITAVAQSVTDLELNSRLAANGTASVIQVAAAPLAPSNASLTRNLMLALVVGLILGVAVALVVENLDTSIDSAADLDGTGLPVFGEIPAPRRRTSEAELPLTTLRSPSGPMAEAYAKVRTAVEFSMVGRPMRTIMVTSTHQSEGKTTLATNLAVALGTDHRRVALLDVDFRRSRLHKIAGTHQSPGLTDHILAGRSLAESAVQLDGHRSGNVIVIPAGTAPPDPASFVSSNGFGAVVERIAAEADLVILDAPPVMPVADALAMARWVDGVLVVVRAGSTDQKALATTLGSLRQVGATVIGLVLIGAKRPAAAYQYYQDDDHQDASPAPGSNRLGPVETAEPVMDLRSDIPHRPDPPLSEVR